MKINPKFFSVPEEKQEMIIRGIMKAFSEAPFNKVSLKDAAGYSGISKGLLIYYFYNKVNLYKFILDEAVESADEFSKKLEESIIKADKIDFFELLKKSTERKADEFIKNYTVMNFLTQAYLEENEELREYFNEKYKAREDRTQELIFQKTDWSKFREGIEPETAYRIVVYTIKGSLTDKFKFMNTDLSGLLEEADALLDDLRKIMYREEFLNK